MTLPPDGSLLQQSIFTALHFFAICLLHVSGIEVEDVPPP